MKRRDAVVPDLERVRTASRLFPWLHGLILVPWGVYLLACALLRELDHDGWPAGGSGATVDGIIWIALLIATLAGAVGIARWYRHRYGRMVQFSSEWTTRVIAGLGLAIFLVLSGMDSTTEPPVALSYLYLGAIACLPALARFGGRKHYLLLGGAILSQAFLYQSEILGVTALTVQEVLVGAAFIVCGILDHRMLMRLLNPNFEEVRRVQPV